MGEFWNLVREIWVTLRHGSFPDLGIWSYVLLMLLVATEGPLSTLLGAAAAAAGYLRIDWVFFAAAAGNIVGDSLWYTVGYAGKPERFYRIGRWLGMHPEHISRLETAMHKHAAKLIILAKLSFGLITPTLIAAGIARVPLRRWLPVVLLMETLWTILIVSVGYHAAGAIARFERSLKTVGIGVLIILLLGVVWYVRRIIRREEEMEDPQPVPPPVLPPSPIQRTQATLERDPHKTRFMLEPERVKIISGPKSY
jgi:membrane protein DedA with SNARE-associated domain